MAFGSEYYFLSLATGPSPRPSFSFTNKTTAHNNPLGLYNLQLYIYDNFSLQLTLKTNAIEKVTGKNSSYTLNCTNLHHFQYIHLNYTIH